MKHSFIRIMSILIALTFCPITQAGTVLEDAVNLRTGGEYNRQKKRREEKLRQRIEEERRENQRKLDAEICKANREEINKIEVLLESTKSQIQKLISFEDNVFVILENLQEIVQKIEEDSNYLIKAKTISKETQDAFNHYIKSIAEADPIAQNLDEISNKFHHLIQISKDENLSTIELIEAALKNIGQTEILLLGDALRESTIFLKEIITNEYSHFLEYSGIFESKAGSPYKNTITIEMRDKQRTSILQSTAQGKSGIPDCGEQSVPPPPPPQPPRRVERPLHFDSFRY